MGKLSRFLHLEKERRPDSAPSRTAAASTERFGSAPPPVAEAEHLPEVALEPAADAPAPDARFRPPPVALESIQLAEPGGGWVGVRCCQCEAENGQYAKRCINCGSRLDTPVQQAFNEKWRRQREQEKAAEDAEVERLRQARAEQETRQRQAMAQAEAILAAERAKSPWLNPESGRVGQPSFGLRLLRLIPDVRVRVAVLVGVVAVPLLIVFLSSRGSGMRTGGMLLVMIVSFLFMPPGWMTRRRRRWWD